MNRLCYLTDYQMEDAVENVGMYFERNVTSSTYTAKIEGVKVQHTIEKNSNEWARFELEKNMFSPKGYTVKVCGPHSDDLNDPKKLAACGYIKDGVIHFVGIESREDAVKYVRLFFKK